METIKAYTNVEQSRKLEEILPIESADMWWSRCTITDFGDGVLKVSYAVEPCNISQFRNTKEDIPCWSLSALISIIPQELFDGEYIINITEGWDNRWILTYDYYDENRNHSYYGLSASADNLVDACTDIIIKLKERNII